MDAVVQMAFRGETPWHGKGADLSEGADIETWRREAGLDFIVAKAPVLFTPDHTNVTFETFDGRFVTYRQDNGTALGVVSDRYQIVQPGEVVDFYREFVEAGDMKLETAGTLLNSRRVWGLASLDHEIKLPGGDVTRPYFLLTTSFDGETATVGSFTSVRVVCWNTLNLAYQEQKSDKAGRIISGFSIGHNSKFVRETAQQQAKNLMLAANEYEDKANLLAATGVGRDDVLRYFVGLVGSENEKGELTPQSRTKIDKLVQLYKSGPGSELQSARGTAFGLLNAITRYVDFEAPQRGNGGGRLASAWYGAGRDLKGRALSQAMELAIAA